MSDQNSFHFIGRLVQSAELKHVGQNDTACVSLTLAVNNWSKACNKEEVNYFDFSYFGKTAENKYKLLYKGCQVSAKGFCKQERWEKDGKKYAKIAFIITDLQVLSFRKNQDTNEKYDASSQNYSSETSLEYP